MQPVLFIHGFMNNGTIWQQWKLFFEQNGFQCRTDSWPFMAGDVKTLTANPHPQLAQTDFNAVVNHYAKIIQKFDQPPILIGHSLGGVIVQKLLSMGYGTAAICINSGPPKGIFKFNWNFIISNALLINPFKRNPLVFMDAKWYHQYVTNELSLVETQRFIDEHCLPASKRVAQTIGTVDFKAPHPPLLFIAGQKDRSQPVAINRANFAAYTDSNSQKQFQVFKNRTHNILAQPDWQAVASYIIDWLHQL